MAEFIIVTRHPGAREWLRRQGIAAVAVSHLDLASVTGHTVVIGNLPVHVAASITSRGGRYWHIAMEVPPEQRGTDLTADAMERFGARLLPLATFHDPRALPAAPITEHDHPLSGKAEAVPMTLVTMLGAPRHDYAACSYRIADRSVESRWFADALVRDGRRGGQPISRVVVIGTPGSAWNLLAGIAGLAGTELEFALFAAVETASMSPDLLAALGTALTRHFDIEVTPLLAPYVDQHDASTVLAAQLALALAKDETLLVDVTFGLRDIMLTVMTTLTALEALRRLKIARVVYAPIRDQAIVRADVVAIPALPEITAWIRAIAALDASGETEPLAEILVKGSPEIAAALGRQALDEKLLRPRRAAERARHLLELVDRAESPVAALFRETLRDRLGWARAGNQVSELQAALARQALESGDIVAAVVLTFEALISAEIEGDGRSNPRVVDDAAERSATQERLNQSSRLRSAQGDPGAADYLSLKAVRNALLHMSKPPRKETVQLLGDREALATLIHRIAARILS